MGKDQLLSFDQYLWKIIINIYISTFCFSDIADGSGGMGGHNLRCGGDDEEEDNVGGDNFYENKVAKGIIRKAYFV